MSDFYSQSELYEIAGCRRRAKLQEWLKQNHIAYLPNVKGDVVAHKDAVNAQFGVISSDNETTQVKLNFTKHAT